MCIWMPSHSVGLLFASARSVLSGLGSISACWVENKWSTPTGKETKIKRCLSSSLSFFLSPLFLFPIFAPFCPFYRKRQRPMLKNKSRTNDVKDRGKPADDFKTRQRFCVQKTVYIIRTKNVKYSFSVIHRFLGLTRAWSWTLVVLMQFMSSLVLKLQFFFNTQKWTWQGCFITLSASLIISCSFFCNNWLVSVLNVRKH